MSQKLESLSATASWLQSLLDRSVSRIVFGNCHCIFFCSQASLQILYNILCKMQKSRRSSMSDQSLVYKLLHGLDWVKTATPLFEVQRHCLGWYKVCANPHHDRSVSKSLTAHQNPVHHANERSEYGKARACNDSTILGCSCLCKLQTAGARS